MDISPYRTPGQLIQSLLDQRGWTQQVLAIVMGIDKTIVSKLIAGKKSLDAPTALILGELFSVDPTHFLELQKQYDLAQARIVSIADPARATRAHLFGGLPIADMVKRGWLPDVDDVKNVPKVEAALTKFFNAKSAEEIEILPHAAKKTNVFGEASPAQLAWLYRVKEIAEEMVAPRFTAQGGKEAVTKLGSLLMSAEEARKVPRILTEAGIRFLLVEALPGSKIDGVCFWLNDHSPVIALSLRHDRIDNFWFVLRHECEHVLQGHGKAAMMLDTELEGDRAGSGPGIADEEKVANLAAANFCVPSKMMDAFISRKQPFFAERDLIGFSRTVRVHPGLVAGQLQHRTKRYDRFRDHLVKIRTTVAPSAIVDGWGDVYPLEPKP